MLDFTVQRVKNILSTEVEWEEEGHLYNGVNKVPQPSNCDEGCAPSPVDDGHIVQEPGDVHIPIQGYYWQRKYIHATDELEEKHLSQEAIEGEADIGNR